MRILLLLTLSMLLSIFGIGCSNNSEPVATNNSVDIGKAYSSNFKQNREDMVIYLKAFNTIINDLSQTITTIRMRYQYTSDPPLSNYISAFQQAETRINDLKSPNISDVKQHQEVGKKLLNDWIDCFQTYKDKYITIFNREDLRILTSFYQQELELNVISERFQLTYNIPALEVNYEAHYLMWDENGWGNPTKAQSEAAKAELRSVQAAMSLMMIELGIQSVTAVTSATNDMSAFPTGNPLYPNTITVSKTTGTYTCTSSGFVTQVLTGY